MRLLTLCGSTRPDSSNARVLAALAQHAPRHDWVTGASLGGLPLFTPERLGAGRPAEVEAFAKAVRDADAVVIATPEYAHNLPACLKSALEWVVASGEFVGKPVVAITVTPSPPRGERCMRSLVWTLQAIDARVLAEVPLYGAAEADELDAIVELLGGA